MQKHSHTGKSSTLGQQAELCISATLAVFSAMTIPRASLNSPCLKKSSRPHLHAGDGLRCDVYGAELCDERRHSL